MEDSYFEGEPLRIGPEPQLLADDGMVEDRWRLTRHVVPMERHPRNPVLVRDKPWEGEIGSAKVIFDEELRRYRMWYVTWSRTAYYGGGGKAYSVAYAESDDGFTWAKPLLDICKVPGFERTNVVYQGTSEHYYGAAHGQVFRDAAARDPRRRYVMMSYEGRRRGERFQNGVNLAYSPDGLHWELAGTRHILDYNSDTNNHMVFDPVRGRWLLYCRPRYLQAVGLQPQDAPPGGFPGTRHYSRRVAMMTSRDLESWSYPRVVLSPDESDPPDYDGTCVFRHGSHFIMLYTTMEGDTTGRSDVRVATSTDGIRWERLHDRKPILGRGEPGQWDAGGIGVGCPPVPHEENLLTYYGGTRRGQHEPGLDPGGIGAALSRSGRFVEQRAGDLPAFLLTREFLLEGNRLLVNTSCEWKLNRASYLKASLVEHPRLGEHATVRRAIESFSLEDCDPITADRLDAEVTWKGNPDIGALKGKPVYVRFELCNASLYSFRIASAP